MPLVLVFDDVQWADASSLNLLQFFIGEMGDRANLLAILTHRDITTLPTSSQFSKLIARLHQSNGLIRLSLDGLNRDAVETLAYAKLGDQVPAELTDLIHSQSNGHPYFVGELIDQLGSSDSPSIESVTVSQGISDLIQRTNSKRRLTPTTLGQEKSMQQMPSLAWRKPWPLRQNAIKSRTRSDISTRPLTCTWNLTRSTKRQRQHPSGACIIVIMSQLM